jgi:hypothetical protein
MKKIVSLIIIFFLLESIFCSCLVFSKDTNLKFRPNLIFNKALQKLENIKKNMVSYQNNISFDLKIREENGEWKDENLTAYIGSVIEFEIKIDTNRGYPLLTAILKLPSTNDGPMFDYIENSEDSSRPTSIFEASDEEVVFIWLPYLFLKPITCTFEARIQEIAYGNISGICVGVLDFEKNINDTKTDSINITSKIFPNPEKPDKPQGPTSGFIFENYTYLSSTIDPNGDQVYYKWDWDDEISDWDGPYDSGYIITAIHSWSANGTYYVRVKAKDTDENESPWSDPLVVSIPKNKAINIPMFLQKILHRFPILNKILNQIL